MMMMFPIFLYIYYMYINKLLRDTMFYYYSFGINMTTNIKMLIICLYIFNDENIYISFNFFILNIINLLSFSLYKYNFLTKKKRMIQIILQKNDMSNKIYIYILLLLNRYFLSYFILTTCSENMEVLDMVLFCSDRYLSHT